MAVGAHHGGHRSSPAAGSREQFVYHPVEMPNLVFALVPRERWAVTPLPHGPGKPSASQAFRQCRDLSPLQTGTVGMGVPRYNPATPNANTRR